jgi:hypothetical protein
MSGAGFTRTKVRVESEQPLRSVTIRLKRPLCGKTLFRVAPELPLPQVKV